ncbi:reverse transcriptase domain-containing protein [Tanacetum coccineum]
MNELNELRDQAYENSLIYKEKTKKIHDFKIKNCVFNVGDRVLLFNSRLKMFSGKLKTCWTRPFTVAQVFPYGTVELSQNDRPNFKDCPDYKDSRARGMDISQNGQKGSKMDKTRAEIGRVQEIKAEGVYILNGSTHLASKFINQFLPPSKTINLRNEITNFQQKFEETFSEAWDRFKDLLRACPHHGFTELHQLDTFYNALNPTDQDSLNAAAGGNLLTKTPRDALTIIENKSKVHTSRNKPVVSKVSANTSSSTTACPSEMAALTDAVNAMLRHIKTSPPETVKAIS